MPLSGPIQDFLDQFSQMLETEGLPRIAGRMLGLLFIDGGEITAEEFAAKLMVSRGSVSTAVRTLEMLGMVQRIKKPGERSERFRLHADPFIPMMQAGVVRAQRMQGMVHDCRTALADPASPAHAAADGRLAELETFFAYAAQSLASMLENYAQTPPTHRNR